MRVFLTALTFSAGAAYADPPRVIADIAPVQAIARAVMDGVGEPEVLLPLSASPHHYSLRPSDASKVSSADVVLWVGPKLSPWLEEPLNTLAPNAEKIALMQVKGTEIFDLREAGEALGHEDHEGHDDDHEGHDHAKHDDDDHEKHDHDEHKDHDHDDHAKHDDHDDHEKHEDDHDHAKAEGHEDHHDHEEHAEEGHHDHHHEGEDPHAWLSPANAKLWAAEIAEHLGEKDPENAARYKENANRFAKDVAAAEEKIRATLSATSEREFIVFHDAFGYFEKAFDVPAHALLHVNDEASPGPRRVAKLRALIAEEGITCAFFDPGHGAAMKGAFEDIGLNTVALHPMGQEGQSYPQILTSMADGIASCLN